MIVLVSLSAVCFLYESMSVRACKCSVWCGGCVCECFWVCMSECASFCASMCYCEMRICVCVYGRACVCEVCACVVCM